MTPLQANPWDSLCEYIPSSPAPRCGPLKSGEAEPMVTLAWAAGEAAARTDVLQTVGATVSARCEPIQSLGEAKGKPQMPTGSKTADGLAQSIPAGYVLIERELLGRVVKRLHQAAERERQELLLPAFIERAAPLFPRIRTR